MFLTARAIPLCLYDRISCNSTFLGIHHRVDVCSFLVDLDWGRRCYTWYYPPEMLLMPATQLFGLGTFWNDDFAVKDWQVYLGGLGILTLCVSIVLSLPTKVKYFETFTCTPSKF